MDESFRADLHCHSICSDGTDTPFELLEKAQKQGLQGLSITDHDTVSAYTPELFLKAKELGIQLLVGAEVSSDFEGISVHILGYNMDLKSGSFAAFLAEMQRRRAVRNSAILEKLKSFKMPIAEEELFALETDSYGRPHIARLMVQKGYVSSIQEAFEKYLKEGAPCYPFGCKYTPAEVIEAIQAAKGKAVLAHPHFLPKGGAFKRILALPFDGIECYYGTLPKEFTTPWVRLAEEKGWVATGGSDYHGTLKPHLFLGSSWTDKKAFLCISM